MEVKNIAEYEENDSQLAKYTIQKLHSIINEAREYINWHYDLGTKDNVEFCLLRDRLLEILEKENE